MPKPCKQLENTCAHSSNGNYTQNNSHRSKIRIFLHILFVHICNDKNVVVHVFHWLKLTCQDWNQFWWQPQYRLGPDTRHVMNAPNTTQCYQCDICIFSFTWKCNTQLPDGFEWNRLCVAKSKFALEMVRWNGHLDIIQRCSRGM